MILSTIIWMFFDQNNVVNQPSSVLSNNIVKATYPCAFLIYGLAIAVLTAKDMPWKNIADIVKAILPLDKQKKIFPTMQGVKLCFVNKKNLSRQVRSDIGCYQWWCCLSRLCQFPSSSSHCTVGNDSIWNRDRQILYLKSRQHEGNVYWFWRKSPGYHCYLIKFQYWPLSHQMVCAQNELHHTVF